MHHLAIMWPDHKVLWGKHCPCTGQWGDSSQAQYCHNLRLYQPGRQNRFIGFRQDKHTIDPNCQRFATKRRGPERYHYQLY